MGYAPAETPCFSATEKTVTAMTDERPPSRGVTEEMAVFYRKQANDGLTLSAEDVSGNLRFTLAMLHTADRRLLEVLDAWDAERTRAERAESDHEELLSEVREVGRVAGEAEAEHRLGPELTQLREIAEAAVGYLERTLYELAEFYSGPGSRRRKEFEARPFILAIRKFLEESARWRSGNDPKKPASRDRDDISPERVEEMERRRNG